MRPQNLHTHTTWCDGNNTTAEMAAAAYACGCGSLGFSSHSCLSFDPSWTMQIKDAPLYRAEVLALREEYAGRMEIWLGLEREYFSDVPDEEPWDFVIGSAHCVQKDGEIFYIDYSREAALKGIAELYGGDGLAAAEDYFRLMMDVPRKTGCQIIGHLDLVAKFNAGNCLFDEEHPRYRRAAVEAVEELAKQDMIFEINTGGMCRGYRSVPYPTAFLMRAIRQAGGRICYSSDAHSVDSVLYGMKEVAQMAEACGFREMTVLTEQGFRPTPLSDYM